MKNSTRVLLFASILGIVCSALLVGTNLYTEPYRRANETAEEIRNFLSALEVTVDPETQAAALPAIFNRDIRVKELGTLTLYEYRPASSQSAPPAAVAVPFSGSGLWGPIKGVLALESDLKTIRGVRFYQQEETPGLGGEIGSEWFQRQFKGKKIVSGSGAPGFRVEKAGTPAADNAVDGITGATVTSDRVQLILDDLARQLGKERQNYVR